MITGIDWLRRQPWSTRLIMSAGFVSVSVIAWIMGYIWPWGYVMAVIPLVIPRRSSVEDDFFRDVKPTDEASPAMCRREVPATALAKTLTQVAAATSSGFGADKIRSVVESANALSEGEEKRFQYVVVFAARPTSMQLTVRRKSADVVELQALSDPRLVEHLKNA